MIRQADQEVIQGTSMKYIILEGIKQGNRFFCLRTDQDQTRLADGSEAYNILGYADTIASAQIFLFGRSYHFN